MEDVENEELEQLSEPHSPTSERNENFVDDPLQLEMQQRSGEGHATSASASGSGLAGENSHPPEDQNQHDGFDLSDIPENENEADTSEDNLQDCLFFFNATFYKRLYRNQLRPRELCQKNIGVNTIPELMDLLWSVSKKHIHRQVIFNGDDPHWSEKVEPSLEDISNFLTLQDPSKRKTYLVTSLTPRVITTWRGKNIKVHIYVYSTSLETNSQYQSVQRNLTAPRNPDRAGAHSTRDDSMLADELRDGHQDLEGHHSSWLLWANYINSSPAHTREQLKSSNRPPLELAKFFRWTGVSEAARLQAVHRGMNVASTVNEGWMNEVREIKKDVSTALSLLQGVSQRVDALMLRGSLGAELFNAMEAAVRPEESELSITLAARVTDCDDIDHV